MRVNLHHFRNDIVSLSVMVLMLVALIAGQAGAAQRHEVEASKVDDVIVNIDFSFRQKGE